MVQPPAGKFLVFLLICPKPSASVKVSYFTSTHVGVGSAFRCPHPCFTVRPEPSAGLYACLDFCFPECRKLTATTRAPLVPSTSFGPEPSAGLVVDGHCVLHLVFTAVQPSAFKLVLPSHVLSRACCLRYDSRFYFDAFRHGLCLPPPTSFE